ncbi:unnamed protein product [Durusdinium trenchii]|uniref:EF-hand domain-containing protein n=1 Tax=Durusdinium trenchii TaxID=1381693 RepID=A0ABP0T1S5_9DINO
MELAAGEMNNSCCGHVPRQLWSEARAEAARVSKPLRRRRVVYEEEDTLDIQWHCSGEIFVRSIGPKDKAKEAGVRPGWTLKTVDSQKPVERDLRRKPPVQLEFQRPLELPDDFWHGHLAELIDQRQKARDDTSERHTRAWASKARAEGGATLLRGTTKWKEVRVPGRLPLVTESNGRWKHRETFQSGFADEATYSEKLRRSAPASRCGSGSVSTMSSVASTPREKLPCRSLFRSQESDSDVEARAALAARPALRAIQLDSLSALTAQRSERGRAAVLKASFSAADKDRDNQLSRAEFSLMLRRAFPEMSRQQIDKEWAIADCQGTGSISFNEFVEWLRPEDDALTHIPLLASFRLWDLSESGGISFKEMDFTLKKGRTGLSEKEIDELLLEIHAWSGDLSFLDFAQILFPPESHLTGRSNL